jgi:uncharacterized protein (DUF2141 family)
MKIISQFTATFLLLMIIAISACNSNSDSAEEAENTTQDSLEIAAMDTLSEIEVEEEIVAGEIVIDTVVIKKEKGKNEVVAKKEKAIEKRKPLSLIIKNLRSPTAPVIVSIYGTENEFPEPTGQLKEYKFKAKGNTLVAKISDVPFGTYAIALYQDENSNGKIDKNFIGYPTEGFAFSNNFKPTVKAPSFKNCAFNYSKEETTVSIKMLH